MLVSFIALNIILIAYFKICLRANWPDVGRIYLSFFFVMCGMVAVVWGIICFYNWLWG